MLRVCLRPRVRLTSKAQSPSGDRLECFQNGGQRPSRPQSHGEHQFSSTLFLLSSLFLPRMLLTFPLPPLGPHYCLQSGPHWAPSILWVSLHRVSPHLEEDTVQPEESVEPRPSMCRALQLRPPTEDQGPASLEGRVGD